MNFSVNFAKIKRQAHSLGRHDSTNSFRYNPFRHVDYGNARRANTFHDAETGRGGFAGDGTDGGAVVHSQTAPADMSRSPTSGHNPFLNSEASGDVPDSQATMTDSPSIGGGRASEKEFEDSSLVRRNVKAKQNGTENGSGNAERNVSADEPEKPKKKQHSGFLKKIEPKEPFTVRNQLQRTFFNSWINVLLLAAPPGIAISYLGVDGRIVFAVNFIAIVPLAAMLSFATEEIALRTGETVGGLINATFGNAVELIVAIIALTHNEIRVVQTSLIGSILSNLLLVLGMCFLFGGINRREQFFNTTVAQTAASLLALAVGSLIIPTIFSLTPGIQEHSASSVPPLSHGVSVILLIVYICYLFFQLKTHSSVFNEESQKVPSKPIFKKRSQDLSVASGVARAGAGQAGVREEDGSLSTMMMNPHTHESEDDDEEEEPQLSTAVAFATLTISTVIIAFCAEGMVGGIEAITATGVSEEFVGLILIPIVGNACEHATAVTVAIKDKMDLAIGVAIGSSMQVALFLIPLLVIIGWGLGNQDMNLSFDEFQVAVLFIAVLLVNYLIGDGKSHWLEGMLLICLYFIIAVCSWCKLPKHLKFKKNVLANITHRVPSGLGPVHSGHPGQWIGEVSHVLIQELRLRMGPEMARDGLLLVVQA
ncbi:Sodium/calcium exchanger protein-domain-containing protein [Microdochium trichocladiopsis]|uniref:Sodium/calcium exchanger protein-domain-containing protein n=1 Tax=Microdochium trichocladiopsis TaxID=1682393 RepID=A0A9P8YA20_9PEZI|nr:Sodium/calcium exchanger protein-domain-containing protein [Microdochium trichocladiopsis]KAH7031425.1 Sodium/calcium exchanger protein-domain-containing protein [Microdochium trichocladiopsis]